MDIQAKPGQIVFTNKARCRDCNRCVRVCPVKAIRVVRGQASVEDHLCIACGTCIRECPQGAKTFRNDVDRAARIVKAGGTVAASVAPSFAAVYTPWERKRLPSALRKLGFAHVEETAAGAYPVALRTAELIAGSIADSHICTACPAVVSYVERYRPDQVPMLTPVASPMIVHSRMLREKLGGNARVVFIGPCVTKKAEAERKGNEGLIDCVITFRELAEWFAREGISLAECEESGFDGEPAGDARFFPLEGGVMRTASLCTDLLQADVAFVSGFDEVSEALDCAGKREHAMVVEPLFCPRGCINGPGIPEDRNIYERRQDLVAFASENPGSAGDDGKDYPFLGASFTAAPVSEHEDITEERIRAALEKSGKMRPEDQLNCGACGYPSCRDKAIAVIRGMAEPEMCIPFMRRLAEQRTDRIIETSPNGIVILDERLHILSMNPAFRKFFVCSEAVAGKHISYLMDPDPFERIASGAEEILELTVAHERYNLVCREILYPLRDEGQYVGIFVNITTSRESQEKLDRLREQTVTQARELLEHQIGMAQEIAKYLGESTARGEALVDNLLKLALDTPDKEASREKRFPWGTGTSK